MVALIVRQQRSANNLTAPLLGIALLAAEETNIINVMKYNKQPTAWVEIKVNPSSNKMANLLILKRVRC